jgi:hypothetical protein
MRTSPLLTAAVVFLGVISPVLANLGGDFSEPATRQGLFYLWFYWLPTRVDLLLLPSGGQLTTGLAMTVYAAQYAFLVAAIYCAIGVSRVALHFLKPHRHRTGLGGSEACMATPIRQRWNGR